MTQSESPFTPCEGVRDEPDTDRAHQHGILPPEAMSKEQAEQRRGQKMLAAGPVSCRCCRGGPCAELQGSRK